MKSYAFCPISDKQINERVARINGAITVLLLVLFGITQSIIPVLFLAFDFLLRATDYARFSPIAISSGNIVRYLSLNNKLINAGPKLFAARIGLAFSTIIVISFIFNAFSFGYAMAGILGLFSFLEAVFGLCVACEIYPFAYRLFYKAKFQIH
jgi:Domain of unknown function (DUF4395)